VYGPHGGPCTECPANQYADALGMGACTACLAHSEAPPRSDAQTDCLCSLGFFGPHGGPCVECPANEYADTLGRAACVACLAHSEAPPRSDAQTDCLWAVTNRNVGRARRLSKRIPRLVRAPANVISLQSVVQQPPARNAGAYSVASTPALVSSGHDQRTSALTWIASATLA
jgi:hypothetical protein